MWAFISLVLIRTACPAIREQDVTDMLSLVWALRFIIDTASGIVMLFTNDISSLVTSCRLQDELLLLAAAILASPLAVLFTTWSLGGTHVTTTLSTTAAPTASISTKLLVWKR